MATLNERQAKLFTDRNWGVIATIREDGSPQATPVWIDYDGENVLVNSAHGRTKVKNVERDPRATVTVLPAADQQSGYVMVSGTATIVDVIGALLVPQHQLVRLVGDLMAGNQFIECEHRVINSGVTGSKELVISVLVGRSAVVGPGKHGEPGSAQGNSRACEF